MFLKIRKTIHIVYFMFLILVFAGPKSANAATMCCPTRDATGKPLLLTLYDPPTGNYAYCCANATHTDCPYFSKCGDGTNNTCGPHCAVTISKLVGQGNQCYIDSRTASCGNSVNSFSEASFSTSWVPVLAQPSPQDLVAVPDAEQNACSVTQ